ncbi:tRNA lysidine(34) synthetase TilS [Nitrosomonas oligotropha]|uniref:tRNA lysidine(34) synthetase TilS n=1 Tax=Nitrosomonas oligotropha TaxID=42354 RepID=UPI00136FFE9C|nr:tRNA lysidine(34) synthetase TilS [Nitrosomonas oligotropha]MXS83507.1 tRNA lysidine(34) synthetase TilS [Nitrosomonas oligotropha]
MAHSRKSKSNSLLGDAEAVLLAHIKPGNHLTIALSGGVDSVVLLDILAQLSQQIPFTLSAVHVNHGISRNAAGWSHFCSDLCAAYGVPIQIATLQLKKETGTSLEAIAREERYRIFSRMQADFVVVAQHLDDQAETLLLQLFRGAGIRGLSAMPLIRKQDSDAAPQILRPLLEISRSRIEAYAQKNQLTWINDESNNDTGFNRNFLRHEILPLLKKRYPSYPKTLLRTSRHLSEASSLLDELAAMDSENCVVSGLLQVERIRTLSFPRAKNLLRYMLSQQGAVLPSTAKLEDIVNQLLSADSDNRLHIVFGHSEIRCFKGAVHILPKQPSPQNPEQCAWQGESCLALRHLSGSIRFTHVKDQGISQQKLSNAPVTVRSRQGGERFMPACNRPRRSLKNLLQEASIPPWQRNTLPLLFCGEQLVWVPGIGIDCEFQVKSGETGILPLWDSA